MPRAIAGRQDKILNPMEVRRLLEQEDQVDHIRQFSLPLNAPSDFARAPQLARAHRQPAEVRFRKPLSKNLFGQHFAGLGAGLIDLVGKRLLGIA